MKQPSAPEPPGGHSFPGSRADRPSLPCRTMSAFFEQPGSMTLTRVAIYLASLEGGGAERAMVDVANGLRAQGLTTDLVVIRDEGPWRRLVSPNVRLVAIGSRRTLSGFVKLLRYLRRDRPDIVVANGTSPIILAMVARPFTPGLVVIARIGVNLSAGKLSRKNLRTRIVRHAQASLALRADAIITNSAGSSADMVANLAASPDKVHTIHNPVVGPSLAEEASKPVEHPWFRSEGTPIILSAGRLERPKDHATLIRAFALMAQQRDGRLVVLGEGTERWNLVRLTHQLGVAHRVDFPGFHANPFSFMPKSRLFVLSSIQEGMPNVLIQAMACGTPVVSTDCPSGPREVLEDGRWGPLVPVGDPQALAEAMSATLDRPLPAASLTARAGAFSAEMSIRHYLRLIDELRGSTV